MGRVFLSLIEDTSGAHDLLVGGSTPASALAAFGAAARNTQENFLAAASKIGLDVRDIPPCVTFFAPVSLDDAGRFRWQESRKRPGDFVDLRAEMNLILVASNCPHPLDPARPAAIGTGHADQAPRGACERGRCLPDGVAGSDPCLRLH